MYLVGVRSDGSDPLKRQPFLHQPVTLDRFINVNDKGRPAVLVPSPGHDETLDRRSVNGRGKDPHVSVVIGVDLDVARLARRLIEGAGPSNTERIASGEKTLT